MGSREPICEEKTYANGVNENQNVQDHITMRHPSDRMDTE